MLLVHSGLTNEHVALFIMDTVQYSTVLAKFNTLLDTFVWMLISFRRNNSFTVPKSQRKYLRVLANQNLLFHN